MYIGIKTMVNAIVVMAQERLRQVNKHIMIAKNKELETQRMAIREATKVKVEQDKQAREAQKIEDKKNGLTVYVETEYGNKAMRVTQQEYQNILRDIKNHCIF